MTLDERMCTLPLIGWILRRLYVFFKKNTFVTDLMHMALGLGLGLLFAGEEFILIAMTIFIAGIIGHMYAFVKGGELIKSEE